MADTAREPSDLDTISDAVAAKGIGGHRLVHEGCHIAQGHEMTNGGVDVDWFHGIARAEADAIEILAKLEKFLEVRTVADAAATFHIGAIWRTANGAESHVVATDWRVVRGVARMQHEFRWAGFHDLFDHGGVKAHALAFDLGTRFAPHLARFRQHEVHANFREDLEGCQVDGFHLVNRYQLHGLERTLRFVTRKLWNCAFHQASSTPPVGSITPSPPCSFRA